MSIKPAIKIFYEAIWFGDNSEVTPIVRSESLDDLVESQLDHTRGKSGSIEVYKIEYNDLSYNIGLELKYNVLDNLELI